MCIMQGWHALLAHTSWSQHRMCWDTAFYRHSSVSLSDQAPPKWGVGLHLSFHHPAGHLQHGLLSSYAPVQLLHVASTLMLQSASAGAAVLPFG
jgi:hypothetical protein